MKERFLRVRPRKEVSMGPCKVELTAMLACWATNADVHNAGPCKPLGQGLAECMQRSVSLIRRRRELFAKELWTHLFFLCFPLCQGGPQKARASTINYHLGKWSKKI